MVPKAAWKFYENRENGESFSTDDQRQWNESKKKETG